MPSVLLRVYLMDDTHKTVYVDPETTTIEELWVLMAQKLLLTNNSPECFFIWAISQDIELLLYSEMTVQDVYEDWPNMEEKYGPKRTIGLKAIGTLGRNSKDRSPSKINLKRSPSAMTMRSPKSSSSKLGSPPLTATVMTKTRSEGMQRPKSSSPSLGGSAGVYGVSAGLADAETESFKLVFRPTAVMSLAAERALVQPEAMHLLYLQAVHHVIQSNYPCTKEAAVLLAGVQLQIALGDQKADHVHHFSDALDRYIPEHLLHQRKADEWIPDLIAAHQLHRGKDSVTLKRQYLETVQRFPFYGATFYKAKYIPSVTSFYKQDYQGIVSLGLNHMGIHIIDPKLMKYETWSFRDLVFWDSLHATFVFEGVTNRKQEPTRRYTFKTQQAELINDLMHDWSEEWQREVQEGGAAGGDGAGGVATEGSPGPSRDAEKKARKEKRIPKK